MAEMSNRIKELRAKFSLTQEELAQKTGVTRQTIIAIEQNKYIPSLLLAMKIAKVFKQKVEMIFKIKRYE